MCCEGKSAKDAFAPTGTWLDRTQKDTFTGLEIAEAEGCSKSTVLRLLRRSDQPFGPLVYWVNGSARIPRLAVIHFHAQSRIDRKSGRS